MFLAGEREWGGFVSFFAFEGVVLRRSYLSLLANGCETRMVGFLMEAQRRQQIAGGSGDAWDFDGDNDDGRRCRLRSPAGPDRAVNTRPA